MGLILETSQKTIEARYSLIKKVSRLASTPGSFAAVAAGGRAS